MFSIGKNRILNPLEILRIPRKGPANTLIFYIQMLIMQISTQKDNHKYRKSVATIKSTLFKKMGLKFRNPKFIVLYKIAFIFFIKCQPFGVWRSIRPYWQNKMIRRFNFSRNKDYVHNISFLT